jgi:hypothetical protein
MGVRPRAVHVHVGKLVLRGLPRGARHEIAAALERALQSRIWAVTPAMLTRAGTYDRVDGGRVWLGTMNGAGVVGERVARAIHAGLTR